MSSIPASDNTELSPEAWQEVARFVLFLHRVNKRIHPHHYHIDGTPNFTAIDHHLGISTEHLAASEDT